MSLRGFTFIDGKVLSLKSSPNGLVMHFQDYADSLVEITFSGVYEFEVNECFSFPAGDTLKEIEGRSRLILKDDEGGSIFSIDFADAEYKFI